MINAKRVEELRVWVSNLETPPEISRHWNDSETSARDDLLSLLDEKAAQMKAVKRDKPPIGPRYAPDCDCPDCNATRRRLGGV